jgi:hypothetical protein
MKQKKDITRFIVKKFREIDDILFEIWQELSARDLVSKKEMVKIAIEEKND